MARKSPRKSKSSFRPSLELLEDRLCPWVGPHISLGATVLPDHLVEFVGQVTGDTNPADATVTLGGAAAGNTTTDANGNFDFTTSDVSLGTATAAAVLQDGSTANTDSGALIGTDSPTITLSITGSTATSVTVGGSVTGIDAPGATVMISGVGSATVTADSGGIYSTTLTTSAAGEIYADNTDSWGQAATEANATRVVVTLTQPDDQTNYDGDTVTGLPITATDSAGNPLTFTAFGLPSGLGINSDSNGNPIISGAIAGNADSPTPYSVTITATDSTAGASASKTFNWTVNNPVSLTSPADQTNYDGDPVTGLAVTASDAEGNALSFSASGLPSGLSEDPNSGVISGAIAGNADSPTPYSVTITATDSTAGASASKTFNWTVNNPVSLTSPADQTNYDGDPVTGLAITASDAEGNALSFSASGLPSGLSEDPNSGVISGAIAGNADSPTPYSVKIIATDSTAGASASKTFNWTVNNPVSLTTPADQTNYDGDPVTGLAITASDAEGNTLSYSATGLPSGLSEDPNSGVISGTVAGNADSPTPYSVTITATDSTAGASASQTFNWTVNNPVSLTNPGAQTSYDGDTVSLPLTSSDAESNTLSFTVTGLPSGLTVNSSSGAISGTVASGAHTTSPYSVTVTANDSASGASASQTFSWTVQLPPLVFFDAGDYPAEQGGSATITVGLSRASTENVTVQYATSDGTADAGLDYVAASGTVTIPAGQTSATVTVSTLDDADATEGMSFNITLSNPTGAKLGVTSQADFSQTGVSIFLDLPANVDTTVSLNELYDQIEANLTTIGNLVTSIQTAAALNTPNVVDLGGYVIQVWQLAYQIVDEGNAAIAASQGELLRVAGVQAKLDSLMDKLDAISSALGTAIAKFTAPSWETWTLGLLSASIDLANIYVGTVYENAITDAPAVDQNSPDLAQINELNQIYYDFETTTGAIEAARAAMEADLGDMTDIINEEAGEDSNYWDDMDDLEDQVTDICTYTKGPFTPNAGSGDNADYSIKGLAVTANAVTGVNDDSFAKAGISSYTSYFRDELTYDAGQNGSLQAQINLLNTLDDDEGAIADLQGMQGQLLVAAAAL